MCINADKGAWNAIYSRGGKWMNSRYWCLFFILDTLASVKPSLRGDLCKHRFKASSTQNLISPHADNSCSFSPQFLHSSSSDPVRLPVLYLLELLTVKWDKLKNCSELSTC